MYEGDDIFLKGTCIYEGNLYLWRELVFLKGTCIYEGEDGRILYFGFWNFGPLCSSPFCAGFTFWILDFGTRFGSYITRVGWFQHFLLRYVSNPKPSLNPKSMSFALKSILSKMGKSKECGVRGTDPWIAPEAGHTGLVRFLQVGVSGLSHGNHLWRSPPEGHKAFPWFKNLETNGKSYGVSWWTIQWATQSISRGCSTF